MLKVRNQYLDLKRHGFEQSDTLLKLIDEYNYCKYVRDWYNK